jgi:tetratricopeptide (TPR) repeat protein
MRESDRSAEELFRAARAAMASGRRVPALNFLQTCAGAGDPDYSARAGAMLADLAVVRGDLDGAERLARTAYDSGTGEGRAAAALSLGGIADARGEAAEARRWFREVMESGPPAKAALAAFNLGVVLTANGDLTGAKAALTTAIASGDPEAAPSAEVNLGILLAAAGDVEGARAAFESAIARDDPLQTAKARLNLHALRRLYEKPGPPPLADDPDERLARIGELQTEAAHHLLASARGMRDPVRQLSLYVSLLEIVDQVTVLSRTPEETTRAVDACRGAVRIGEMLAKRYPYEASHHTLGINAAGRLGDLHVARAAPKDARKWYGRAYRAAVKLANAAPESALGPLTAARTCRQLAEVEPDRAPALLEESVEWVSTAAGREPANLELPYERCLTYRQLGRSDPSRAAEAAARIIEDYGTAEGRLPLKAAEALAWARTQTS